jgi:hypothetical protein
MKKLLTTTVLTNGDVETIEVVADKGYESRDDIENCVMNGIIPNVAFKYDKDERLYSCIRTSSCDLTSTVLLVFAIISSP